MCSTRSVLPLVYVVLVWSGCVLDCQVGLVAVNVIGERVEPSGSGQVQPHPLQDVETQERIVHSYLPGYHGNK